jgi:hypothetical protein
MDTSAANSTADTMFVPVHVWPRKLTKTVLRTHGTYSTHGLLLKGECAIEWQPAGDSRMMIVNGWRLWRKGYKFANAPWYDHGQLAFNPMTMADKQAKLLEAVEWAQANLGVPTDSWVRSPFGSYVPVVAMLRAKERCGQ